MPSHSTRLLPGVAFASPSVADRPVAFWSWNGSITREGITRALEEFLTHGFGAAFVHPRPGLVTEYLSEEWWDLWQHALAEAKRLGLLLHIYDENSYPAGFAGGHVPSRNPDTVASCLSLTKAPDAASIRRWSAHAWFALMPHPVQVKREEAMERFARGCPILALREQRASASPFLAGFGYVDLTHPDTTREFLATTYEEYVRRFSDSLGQEIKYAFTDEPNPYHGDGWAISQYLLSEFVEEHGYHLEDSWWELCFGDGSVQYDYFQTVNRLFLDGFVSPLDEFCQRHRLALTGHYWEHNWPDPGKQPDNMAALARMQIPGNDLLEFQINRPDFWPKIVLNLKELSSVAAQKGSARTMVENGGAGGYTTGIREFRRTDHCLLCFGVTLFVPHLTHYSLAGSRKYEWPQTLGEPASWWKHYGRHADHLARVVSLLTHSKEENRVAVLLPTRSGWLSYAPASLQDCEPSTAAQRQSDSQSLEESFTRFLLELYKEGIDFDLVEETALASSHYDAEGRLQIGDRTYECLLVSGSARTLVKGLGNVWTTRPEVASRIYVSRQAELRENGRPSPLRETILSCCQTMPDDAALVGEVLRILPSRILPAPLPERIAWHRRVLDNDSLLYLFANCGEEAFRFEFRTEHSRVYRLDTKLGNASPVENLKTCSEEHLTIELLPGDLGLFLVTEADPVRLGFEVVAEKPSTVAGPIVRDIGSWKDSLPCAVERVNRCEPNVLVLDYCFLEDGSRSLCGEEGLPIHVLAADQALWQKAGWKENAWDRAVQFRKNILDRQYRPMLPRVTYPFFVSEMASAYTLQNLHAVLERSHLFRVYVNGHIIPDNNWNPWRMEEFFASGIGAWVVPGRNELRLEADSFHPLMEIAPAFLAGDFRLENLPAGFCVSDAETLGAGEIIAEGLPFYHGELEYEICLPEASSYPAALEVSFAGEYLSMIGAEQTQLFFHSPVRIPLDLRHDGKMKTAPKMRFRIGASAANLFGPHHSEGLALSFVWRNSPRHPPSGKAYRVHPCGLLAASVLVG